MSELIISVSGLRGIVGQSLTPDVALRYAAAFAAELPPGPVILSRDGRASGGMVAGVVRSTLQAAGRDVLDAGVAATPTTGVLVRQWSAAGGIQISASHNPPEYNGMKLFGGEGRVIPAAQGERVADRFRRQAPAWRSHEELGSVQTLPDPHAQHLQLVLATVDVAAIAERRLKVLLDANHGAGAALGRRLLEALGCQVVVLGEAPSGLFRHSPEPTAENLAGVQQDVVNAQAVVGFCQDPDADRLALIDERGKYVGEEYTLALTLDHVLRGRPGPVVVNCATSRMCEDVARRHGATLHRSAVGEANVVDEMNRREAVFGGEGNGGPIDPRVGLVRDSFVGMAQILAAMASTGKSISQLTQRIPAYHIVKQKAPLQRERIPAALDRLEAAMPDAVASRLDGLRLDWPDRWLLLRASNTEPIIRAIAEAPTAEQAEHLCEKAIETLRPD